MSRIKIQKQLELSSAARSVIVTNSLGQPIYQFHGDALVEDLDITLFDALVAALDPANDYVVMYSSGDNKSVKVPVSSFLGSAGGTRWRSITVDSAIAQKVQAKSTAASIVVTNPASDTYLTTIPDGVDMDAVQIWLAAKDNPGSTAKFQFDFQGTQADGSARLGTSDDSVIVPDVFVANNQLPTIGGSLSSTNYLMYEKRDGVGLPEVRLTGRGPLEITIVNFNQNNAAGNGEAFVKFVF